MAFNVTHRAVLQCEVPIEGTFETARLVFQFRECEPDAWGRSINHVPVIVRLTFPDSQYIGFDATGFSACSDQYGYSIARFVRELEELRRNLSGSTYWYSWDSDRILCFTVTDPRRGKITIGGALEPAKFSNTVRSESEGEFLSREFGFRGEGGIRICFDGIETDQSYLNEFLVGIHHFLSESDIHVTDEYPY